MAPLHLTDRHNNFICVCVILQLSSCDSDLNFINMGHITTYLNNNLYFNMLYKFKLSFDKKFIDFLSKNDYITNLWQNNEVTKNKNNTKYKL